MNPKLVLATLCFCAPCWAQQAPAPKAPVVPAAAEPAREGEPAVKRTVIEDEGARIEELRVRGEAQRIVVTPKVGIRKSYEIMTGDGARDAFDGTGGARSSAGKRVWNVLQF
ncbi:MAG: DUF2782 domain-containing protein [Burkholderiaceae bacterium]